ncbi:MAG: 30S ribosomal protein S11 [Candidatus Aminicenantes bacterium]|nr:30S ribosomal protein S11 [Candidatus Aminicenantes bacterium]MBL7082097.1 30S ribosomal protein S11 [Candidatus Aminicenantes bacterium]
MPKAGRKPKKKKVRKEIGFGVAYIQSTFNNTIITITDQQGNTVCWASAGTSGFKGARKGTPFASQLAAKEASIKAREYGVRYVDVKIKGPGAGRESAIRALQVNGIEIKSIKDVTPIPHNGCRVRKRRRV